VAATHARDWPWALALLLLGGLLLFLGVQLHTRRAALRATLEHLVPAGLRTLLPPRRE